MKLIVQYRIIIDINNEVKKIKITKKKRTVHYRKKLQHAYYI